MQKDLQKNLEALLDVNADSFEVMLEFIRAEVIDDVDVAHLSAVTVARDILKIDAEKSGDARVILMALAYPHEPQEVIATLCGVSVRTVKRVFARWKSSASWIASLVDLRCAIAPRKGGRF